MWFVLVSEKRGGTHFGLPNEKVHLFLTAVLLLMRSMSPFNLKNEHIGKSKPMPFIGAVQQYVLNTAFTATSRLKG